MAIALDRRIEITQIPPNPLTVDDFDGYYACVELQGGCKRLTLNFELRFPQAFDKVTDYIENIRSDEGSLNTPGLTTALYTQAREVMQLVSDLRRRQTIFLLTTRNPKIIAWAMDSEKGVKVFDWDKIDYKDGLFNAFKTFYPQNV